MDNQKDLNKFFEERYQEVSDNPKDNINYFLNSCSISCVGILSIILAVVLLIIFNWIVGLCVLVVMGLVHFISKMRNKPSKYESPKEDYSQRIKSFIGFDFGDHYKMGIYGSHDYEEFLLLFEDKDFEKVREYCEYELNKVDFENTKEGEYGFEIDNDIYILPYVHSEDKRFIHKEKRAGFSKLWRPDNGLGAGFWWHTLEVDYEDKTLRFTLVGF